MRGTRNHASARSGGRALRKRAEFPHWERTQARREQRPPLVGRHARTRRARRSARALLAVLNNNRLFVDRWDGAPRLRIAVGPLCRRGLFGGWRNCKGFDGYAGVCVPGGTAVRAALPRDERNGRPWRTVCFFVVCATVVLSKSTTTIPGEGWEQRDHGGGKEIFHAEGKRQREKNGIYKRDWFLSFVVQFNSLSCIFSLLPFPSPQIIQSSDSTSTNSPIV